MGLRARCGVVVLLLCCLGGLGLCDPAVARDTPRAPNAIAGYWRTSQGEAIIHIATQDAGFAGTIAALAKSRYPDDDPGGMGGQPVVDRHNPDPAKRHRRLIGLHLIKGLDYHIDDQQQARWRDGRIYDSERGKWYDCTLWLADRNHLQVHGYIGLPVLGRTTTWTRVSAPDAEPAEPSTAKPSPSQETDS